MRFLLVEDNDKLAQAVSDRLSLDGHVIDRAPDLDTAEAFVTTAEYDLILLDIMLPDGDGRHFLQTHRAANRPTPIVVLTARSEVSDRVGVLDLGADDYLVKPFDFAELEARCRAVLRRRAGGASNVTRFGDIAFDATAATLSVGGREVQLRNRELRLFEVFMNAPDQVFSKSNLMDRLFSYDADVSENAIEVYVGRLRRHLAGAKAQIVTVRGLGYRLSLT